MEMKQAQIATQGVLMNAQLLLQHAGLAQGMRYADFGCGMNGHFVLPACKLVGERGRVYAVDILKSSLASLESRAKQFSLTAYKSVWGDIERPGGVAIQDHSIDLVSLVNMGPLIKKSPALLREAYRVLTAHGTLLVIDWKRACGTLGPVQGERLSSRAMQDQLKKAGWEILQAFDAGSCHFGLLAQKRIG